MATFTKIQEIVAEELGQDQAAITPETSFESLGADSLDIFQVISEIEDEFDVTVEASEGLKTINDLVVFVDENK
jgi:acyl carrier protein